MFLYIYFLDEIMSKIREAGFHIAARKETELTKDIAEQFYGEHKDKEYFNDLTEHMARYNIYLLFWKNLKLNSSDLNRFFLLKMKIKNLPLKSTDWKVDFSGSIP